MSAAQQPPAQPRLLFLHPVGLEAGSAAFLDGLPPVAAATFPGHGGRRRARAGLTLQDIADEIAGWTSGPLDVIGASLGGMVALHFALDHPQRVRSLVLACTTPYGDPAVMSARADATVARGSADMLAETLDRWFTPEFLARAPEPPGLTYARRRLLAMNAGALADTWRAIGSHDVRDRLAAISAPVTCIAGRHDKSTPLDVMTSLSEGLPRSRLEVMDASHMAFLELPREFSAAVRRHLAWVADLTASAAS